MRQDVLAKALEDPRSTPARLLDAAEEVFAEKGFGAASTREIARRARVPFGALHYHWGSKKELGEAVMVRLVGWIRDTVVRNFVPGHTPGAIIDAMVDAFLDALASNRHAVRLLYRSVLEPPPPSVQRMFDELQDLGVEMLREVGLETQIDSQAAILFISTGFLAVVADEPGQRVALGGSIFTSRAARERLRAELRRVARLVFQRTP
jgi:AcrR family transcriptional regulator